MVRLIPQFRGPIDPESLDHVDDLVQARIDGGISRRQLIQRAAQIGIAAPVVGVMLHATSDMAAGAPSQGRDKAIARMQDAATKEVTGPTAPAGNQVAGGTLISSTIEEPDTINPWTTQLVTGFDVFSAMYEGFMTYDSNQTLIPKLATEFSISDDGLSYTWSLQQGVTFHNGEAFNAHTVVSNWNAIMSPDYSVWSQQGWDQITAIETPDDYTVVMHTANAFAPFITYIGGQSVYIPASLTDAAPAIGGGATPAASPVAVSDAALEAFRAIGRAPIGTGPFSFVEWKAKEQIVFGRNENYWGTKAILDQIIYRINPDDNTQLVQIQTGEVQMAAGSGSVGSARLDEVLGFGTVDVYARANQGWSHFDLKHVDHLRVTKVRQALEFATPVQEIIDNILKGRVQRCTGDQSPITPWYNANITPRTYDPEMAKQLLTEAGLTQNGDGIWEGPTPTPSPDIDPNTDRGGPSKPLNMEFWYIAGDSVSSQIAQVVAQSWNTIGIKTEAKSEDVSTIWGPEGYQWNPDTMTACMYSWFNGNDPDDMYYWHSSQIPPDPTGAGGNALAYFFPFNFQAKIDELTENAAHETDATKRKALYDEIQTVLYDEAPVTFTWWGMDFSAVQPKIGGFWPSPFNNLFWNAQEWYFVE